MRKSLIGLVVLVLLSAGFLAFNSSLGSSSPTAITIMTHDSFLLSESTISEFEAETGINLEIQTAGDAGTLLASAVLAAGTPTADVIFGIDNTLISKALAAEIFEPYESGNLKYVSADLVNTYGGNVTPIDFGDVCINYDKDYFGATPPATLQDLTSVVFGDELVVTDPAASSPGLAFLLATISAYGDRWPEYWKALRANGVKVSGSWSDAYYVEFTKGGAGGNRPLVLSYSTSPAAEIVYAKEPKPTVVSTGVMTEGCYRQIEYAGILRGTENAAAASQVIDWLLSEKVQRDITLNMFVYPARADVELPDVFAKFAAPVETSTQLNADEIALNLDAWLAQWESVMKN